MRICANVTKVWQNGRKHWPMPKSGLQSWTPFSSGSTKILFRENFLTSVSKLSTDYEKEQHQLQDVAAALRDEIEAEEQKSANVERFLSVVERYTEIPELTPCILHEFVEKIVVHAASDPKARTAPRKLTSTIRALELWKYPKSLHQGKNEKNGIAEAMPFLCWRYLFSRFVSKQVSSAQVSLTSVFGMGTGGPSLQSTPTAAFRQAIQFCLALQGLVTVRESNPCLRRERPPS